MSISKLALSARKPAASAAAAFVESSSRRGKPTSEVDAGVPSFGDTLQESRTQLTHARPADAETKPSKAQAHDNPENAPGDAQTPADAQPATPQTAQDSSNNDPQATSSAPDKKDPDSQDDAPANPASDPVLQALTASLNAAQTLAKAPVFKGHAGTAPQHSDPGKLSPAGPAPAQADLGTISDEKAKAAPPPAPPPPTGAPADKATPDKGAFGENTKARKDPAANHDGAAKANVPEGTDDADQAPRQWATIAVPPVVQTPQPVAAPAKPESPAPASGVIAPAGAGPVPLAVPPAEVALPAHDSHVTPAEDPLDQIVLGLKSNVDVRSGKAEIRLDPPNLGTVKVSLSLQAGALTAQFESASEMVRDLLKTHLDKLKTVLQDQGVAVDRLAVAPPADAKGQGQSSFGSATHDGRSAGQYQQDPRQQRGQADAEAFAGFFSKAQEAPLDLVA